MANPAVSGVTTSVARSILRRAQVERMSFLTAEEVVLVAACEETRLFQLLVRCGGCRFVCAAQDVAHLIRCVEAGGDYVRDVSVPASAIV